MEVYNKRVLYAYIFFIQVYYYKCNISLFIYSLFLKLNIFILFGAFLQDLYMYIYFYNNLYENNMLYIVK